MRLVKERKYVTSVQPTEADDDDGSPTQGQRGKNLKRAVEQLSKGFFM